MPMLWECIHFHHCVLLLHVHDIINTAHVGTYNLCHLKGTLQVGTVELLMGVQMYTFLHSEN